MGIVDSQCCNYNHLLSDFSSKFESSMTIFYYINVRVHNLPSLFQQMARTSQFLALTISCTNMFGYKFIDYESTKLSCE